MSTVLILAEDGSILNNIVWDGKEPLILPKDSFLEVIAADIPVSDTMKWDKVQRRIVDLAPKVDEPEIARLAESADKVIVL